jgi:hypothetical protein
MRASLLDGRVRLYHGADPAHPGDLESLVRSDPKSLLETGSPMFGEPEQG